MRKPPAGPPPSAGVLARHAQAYAREAGVSEGRVRAWISYMIMAGVLERTAAAGDPHFSVKGGVALDYAGLREACESVFRTRRTHDWPPALVVPPHWIEPFARLAGELDLPVSDAQRGMARVEAFVQRVRSA